MVGIVSIAGRPLVGLEVSSGRLKVQDPADGPVTLLAIASAAVSSVQPGRDAMPRATARIATRVLNPVIPVGRTGWTGRTAVIGPSVQAGGTALPPAGKKTVHRSGRPTAGAGRLLHRAGRRAIGLPSDHDRVATAPATARVEDAPTGPHFLVW